ncbi:hypothetical protein [Streptomyces fuscigenes]|uniref:hypothetical protein n=1 Tax=Streptomyces fuscigenes TaxID=1528880 RepID=UPI001F214E24|nr:hypothetical protein [Streptomyces fuscigenes]MCF3960432.1 hypothetical protein [Streptomyces fuscigenes]
MKLMRSHEFLAILRMLLDADPKVREGVADEITDRLSSYAPAQASALATLLAATAVAEKDAAALEAELHAILELASTGHVAVEHISSLEELNRDELLPELREYVEDLLSG